MPCIPAGCKLGKLCNALLELQFWVKTAIFKVCNMKNAGKLCNIVKQLSEGTCIATGVSST